MSSIAISGDSSGAITIAAPTIAGTNTMTLVAGTGSLAPKVLSTAVASTSGTAIDFTSIPSWVTRITVMFNGVSTSGTSNLLVQIGAAGGIEATGYAGATASTSAANVGTTNSTTGVNFNTGSDTAATTRNGLLTICNLTGNTWVFQGILGSSDTARAAMVGYAKTLSGPLTQVRITTVNGTDTFDAGTINITYE